MAEEDFSAPTKLATDQMRVTMVRCGHGGQFTKMEKKVDAFMLRNIDSQTQL